MAARLFLLSFLLIIQITESSEKDKLRDVRPIANAASQEISIPKNGQRRIELLEEYTIPDGIEEVLLPLEVSLDRIIVEGNAAPRVVSVNCTSPDGVYGAGQELNITVSFTTGIKWEPLRASKSDM